MYSLFFLATVSVILSLVLTPVIRNWFIRLAIVDHPAGGRRIHEQPVPRVGGIAIILTYVLAFVALVLSPLRGADLITNQLSFIVKAIPAAVLIFAVGLIDDLIGLRPWQKFLGQIAAASLACWADVRITNVIGQALDPVLGIPLTILWLVACTNAFNLIDGMDGLATGAGLLAALTILTGGLLQNNTPLLFATVPLIGALLGFLRYNFHPASIFLGDSGSLTIGFLLGCYGLIWSQKSATLLGMTAPLIAFSLPLIETSLSMFRRFLRKQPIFAADRGHIHHRLLDRGLSPKRAVLMLYLVCGIAAVLSLLQTVASNRYSGVVTVLFCAVAWMGIQRLNYFELQMAGKMFFGGTFQRVIDGQVHLKNFENALVAASDLKGCWTIIHKAGPQFGFQSIEINKDGARYSCTAATSERNFDPQSWSIQLPLPGGSIVLQRDPSADIDPLIVAPFLDTLQRALSFKLQQFTSQQVEIEAAERDSCVPAQVR